MQSSANKCIYLRSGKCFFTICSSCSVETKPSLVCSFSSLPQFQRNLSHFVPFPTQLLRDSASWILSLVSCSHKILSSAALLCSFKPLFSILFFVIWIFHFFLFRVFLAVIMLYFVLKLVEHDDDVGVVFIITDHQLLWAFLRGTVHILRDLLHLGSFLLDLWQVKSFSFGLSGIDWSNWWARRIYRWKASLTMRELAMALLTKASEAGPRESLVITPGIPSKKSIQEKAAPDICFSPIDGSKLKFFTASAPAATAVLMQKLILPT